MAPLTNNIEYEVIKIHRVADLFIKTTIRRYISVLCRKVLGETQLNAVINERRRIQEIRKNKNL